MSERRVVAIRGVVQGVGFRPYIYGIATTLHLRGHVRNDAAGVVVDVEGPSPALDRFLAEMRAAPPPLSRIESVSFESAPLADYRSFTVEPSDTSGHGLAHVSPDAATCDACLGELFDPSNRRHRHPFITCTHCGPRLTIQQAIPYDRARTTMAAFPMCDRCRAEYGDPTDRRFHAQPIACPDCGPVLEFTGGGAGMQREQALEAALRVLVEGGTVAVKGLGGYHLCCDATNDAAVRGLRKRKRREARPFALMVRSVDEARPLAEVSEAEEALLRSPARPIVLLEARERNGIAPAVAPGVRTLGVMLAYTPLHHLLLADLAAPVVMTSGNASDEPIAYDDADALQRLGEIADGFLTHDRPITMRCDDSVMRASWGGTSITRRSRGHAPSPIRIPSHFAAPVLALGGHLKNTFCLGREDEIFLSHHIGDLEHPTALRALQDGIAHYGTLLDIVPEVVAHDLHPEYASSRLAADLLLPCIAVQHHHAHVAGCAAEHGVTEPVLGVALDGSGAGADGTVWGGELLLAHGARFERLGHLGCVPLPGGDAAVREPWRMAAAHLFSAYGAEANGLSLPVLERHASEWPVLRQMMERGFNAVATSSVGRLFDAVASLIGLIDRVQYEAQAAIALETIADRDTTRSYAPELHEAGSMVIADPGAIVRGVVGDLRAGRSQAEIAGRFHNAVRDLVVAVVTQLVRRTGVRRVALTGGVFQNQLLLERTADALTRMNCVVLVHRRVPCNDGGLSFGQAVVAAAHLSSEQG